MIAAAVLSTPLHAAELQITNLQDVDLGTAPPDPGDIEQQTSFCIAMKPAGPVQLTASGTGTNGTFALSNIGNPNDQLPLRLFVSRQRPHAGEELQPGIPMMGLRGTPPHPSGGCDRPLTYMTILVEGPDIAAAPGGHYSGLVQLMVAPE